MTSVTHLRPPTMAGPIAAARDAVDDLVRVPAASVSTAELSDALVDLVALESRIAAVRLAILDEADRRGAAEQAGATATDAWAASLTGTTRGVMSGGLWLAKLLRERYHATREAFAAGRINEAQMRVVVASAERMPDEADGHARQQAELALVAKAVDGLDPRRLRHAGRRMLEVVSRRLADVQEADNLRCDERRAEAETWFALHDNGDGTFSGRFMIPELHGQMLRTALERLTAPRRLSRDRAGRPVRDDTLPGDGPGLSWSERLGAALCELVENLPAAGHGGVAATVLVHLDHRHLLDGLAAARLDTGTRISVGEARRLACNAGILPVVLGGRSEPLDVGREQRLHTRAQRRALAVLHDSCAAQGCDRPFAWCEVHHPHAWADGGRTSVDNALPLCHWHHRRAHDDRYRVTRTQSGEVRFRRRT